MHLGPDPSGSRSFYVEEYNAIDSKRFGHAGCSAFTSSIGSGLFGRSAYEQLAPIEGLPEQQVQILGHPVDVRLEQSQHFTAIA